MPLNLDLPKVVNRSITSFEITAFAVDLERGEIHVTYDKGEMIASVFSPVFKNILLTIDGPDFLPAIAGADIYANAMTAGSISVYGALKLALYDEIQEDTGLTGTVS